MFQIGVSLSVPNGAELLFQDPNQSYLAGHYSTGSFLSYEN